MFRVTKVYKAESIDQAELPQKQLVSRVLALVPMGVAKVGQEFLELAHVARRHLHADQHAAVVGAVVAVVEEADIPASAHLGQEIHQRTRLFRKFEAVEQFVQALFADRRGVAADHVTNMVLGHFVVGQVQSRVAVLLQALDQFQRFLAVTDLDADENMGFAGGVVAVVEFGDVALADQGQEFLVGAGLLGQRDGKDGFALFAKLGALGDEAQAVEIHVGAGGDGDQVFVLQRGSRRDLVDLARKNADFKLDEAIRLGRQNSMELEMVRDRLGLARIPRRMECIDIANLQGTAIVASCVCFVDGKAAKENYRHYNIRGTDGEADDVGSVREVVERRLKRGVEEETLPDLLVIDGGRGHLNAATEVAQAMGLGGLSIVALAKAKGLKKFGVRRLVDHPEAEDSATARLTERVFLVGREEPVDLKAGTPEYRLLTRLRDEAHRFANTHHRKKRGKQALGSDLLDVPGIGEAMRRKLLEEFGGLEGLRRAGLETLRAVKGLRDDAAVELYSRLRDEEKD